MRKFSARMDVKWLASILLIFCLWLCLFSGVSVLYLGNHGAYADQGFGLRDEAFVELLRQDLRVLTRFLQKYPSPIDRDAQKALETALNERFSPALTNVRYVILQEDTGSLVAGDPSITERSALLSHVQAIVNEDGEWTERRVFSSPEEADAYEDLLNAREGDLTQGYTRSEENGVVTITVRFANMTRYRLRMTVDEALEAKDKYYYTWNYLNFLLRHRGAIIVVTVSMAFCSLFLLVLLVQGAGRRVGQTGIQLLAIDRVPIDLQLLLTLVLAWAPWYFAQKSQFVRAAYSMDYILWFIMTVLLALYEFSLGLVPLLSAVRQWKAGVLSEQAVTWRLLRLLGKCARAAERGVPIMLRLLGFYLLLSLAELAFLLVGDRKLLLIFWLLVKAAVAALILVIGSNLSTLQKGSEALSRGEIDRKIRLEWMLPVLRRLGENLNNISIGMKKTLNEQTRSERMKAELITNVSHDLKTPLTSIVNYVDLLKKVGLTATEAQEYLDVLDRQSVRLKKLVLDLVEASKASTGNIPVELEELDLNLLLSQAAGEYAERMQARKQELVVDLEESLPPVLADPKLLWRVIDNLLLNALQYSQPGTRVYLSSTRAGERAEVILRNVSGQRLNISAEELMERFVRGDTSRNTEGSGLGLSIAQSLVELQNAEFHIVIDGDLFKAILDFPLSETPHP